MKDTQEDYKAILDQLKTALEAEGLFAKGDGSYEQMARTIIVIVQNNKRLRDRLQAYHKRLYPQNLTQRSP